MYAFGYQEGAISKLFAMRLIDDVSIGLACYQRYGALIAALDLRSTIGMCVVSQHGLV